MMCSFDEVKLKSGHKIGHNGCDFLDTSVANRDRPMLAARNRTVPSIEELTELLYAFGRPKD